MLKGERYIADGFDILQRTEEYPYGNWIGETCDIDLTRLIVELLNSDENEKPSRRARDIGD